MMSKNSENLSGAITDGDVGMSSEMSQPQHGMALSPELLSGREGSFQQVGPGGNPSINMSREETYHDHRQLNPSLHMSHEESFHDHRQVHQTVQNFVTNPGLDHQVVAEAVEAVTGARSEAAQAMLSARTQVLHANVQFESQVAQLRNEIVARDAALSLAIEKEKLLSTKLEESMKEAEALRSNINRLSQNGAGETEQAIVLRVAEIEKTLATMLMRLDQMGHPQGISQAALNAAGSSSPSRLTRLESMVENLKVDQARDRDSVQLLYAEIVEMKQDKWWAEDVGSPSNPEIRSQQGASPMNRAGTFEMFSDDEQEHHAASSSAGVRDVESESLTTKDLHHFKVPPLPNDAGQFRSWKNSLRALIMSYDRSSTGMVLDWFNKALVARTPDECKELADSSGDFPRFDRVITAALCKPEHLRSHFGVPSLKLVSRQEVRLEVDSCWIWLLKNST